MFYIMYSLIVVVIDVRAYEICLKMYQKHSEKSLFGRAIYIRVQIWNHGKFLLCYNLVYLANSFGTSYCGKLLNKI